MFLRLCESISRHWAARKLYRGWGDWIAALYNRALLRLPRVPLPWRNKVTAVRVVGVTDPLYARLGTSDWLVVEEVFADCASWIGRVRHMVVEVHGAYTADQFLDDLRRAGGRFELYGTITDPSRAVLFLAASVA